MADIDVSYVDDLYLPVAASVDNHGATGYMGSAQDLTAFKQRVNAFRSLGWPAYSAYLDQYWAENAFSALLPPELGGGRNPPPGTTASRIRSPDRCRRSTRPAPRRTT